MADFSIEYRKIGQLATCVGNQRLRIDADGGVYHAINTLECDAGELWSDAWHEIGRLDGAAMAQLLLAIRQSGVLALAPLVSDDSAEGGRREELDISIDDEEYHLAQQNRDQPAFTKTVRLLWGAMAIAEMVPS